MSNLVIPNGGTIGSAGDTDAISISSSGAVTLNSDFVPATPLSHRNMVINGAMQVWQRGTDITCLNNSLEGYNSADRYTFLFNSSCPGTLDVDRSTDTPDGFGYSMKLKCNATATPVGSSADYIWVSNRIEAQDLQHLNYGSSSAKEMTLSWYMKSANYTSPISIYIEKPDGTVSYFVKSFTPTTSWARYTMTIPANTNSGHTIANDNGLGLSVNIVLAGSDGGNYEQTGDSTAWGTTEKYYTDTQGNFFSSTSNELYITGLQLELGTVATPFEHRSFADELIRCQRYYNRVDLTSTNIFMVGSRFSASSGGAYLNYNFPVAMRSGSVNFEVSARSTWNQGSGYGDQPAYRSTGSTHGCTFHSDYVNVAANGILFYSASSTSGTYIAFEKEL